MLARPTIQPDSRSQALTPRCASSPRRWATPLMLVALGAFVVGQLALLVSGIWRDVGSQAWDGALLGAQLFALATSAVLLWRMILVATYRAVPGVGDDALPTLAVIVPAYNEGRQVYETLHSLWRSDYPKSKLRVIALDDGSKDDTWSWMDRAARELGPQVFAIRCPSNRGKRRALYEGFLRTDAEIVVTVDSDSEVLPDTLRNLVSPLVVDPRVGGVAGNVRVLNAEAGAIPKMLDVAFTYAFEFMRASESRVDTVMCCPGALSAYRRAIIDEFRDAWVCETFLGQPAGIGEDRAMTNEVLRRGHLVRFQANAIVLTEVPTTTAQLSRMMLRWARSNVREAIVMAGFAFRRFRASSMLGARVNLVMSIVGTLMAGIAFLPTVLGILANPVVLPWVALGATVSGIFPAIVFAAGRGLGRALWAFPYAVYSLLCLAWIGPWALLTPHRSSWLTRALPTAAPAPRAIAPSVGSLTTGIHGAVTAELSS